MQNSMRLTPSLGLQLLFFGFIVLSGGLIVFPTLQHHAWAKVLVSGMNFVLLVIGILRGAKTKTNQMTISEIYVEAKKGRKFAPASIELACLIAVNIAFWKTI